MSELVRVYRNLHKPGMFSVKAKRDGKWVVINHVTEINLINCKFVVKEGGRQRTISTQREVHAWVEGFTTDETFTSGAYCRYNPYICGDFVNMETGKPETSSAKVVMKDCKTFLGQ